MNLKLVEEGDELGQSATKMSILVKQNIFTSIYTKQCQMFPHCPPDYMLKACEQAADRDMQQYLRRLNDETIK